MASATKSTKGWPAAPTPAPSSDQARGAVVGANAGGGAKANVGSGAGVVHPHTRKQVRSVVTQQGLRHGSTSTSQSLPISEDQRY